MTKKRTPPIGIRLDSETRTAVKLVVPNGFSEHATLVALIRLGLRSVKKSPERILRILESTQHRVPKDPQMVVPPTVEMVLPQKPSVVVPTKSVSRETPGEGDWMNGLEFDSD